MGALAASLIQELWQQAYNPSWASATFGTSTGMAAFQLAIWKLEYDGYTWGSGAGDNTTSFAKGLLTADLTSSITTQAQALINALVTPTSANEADLMALADPSTQDLVGAVTPEPASVIVWSVIGALGLVALRRRHSVR